MIIKELQQQQFDEFAKKQERTHFMQSYPWGEVNKKRGYLVHHLGFFNEDKLCATALLLEKKVLKWSTFYCPRGPIANYQDNADLTAVISGLKQYVKNHHGLYLKLDPDLIIHKLDKDGNIIEDYPENLAVIAKLKDLGGKHKGFTTNFIDTANPRFTFRVNVNRSEEELLSSFHNTTRKILKENNPNGLILKKGDSSDITAFYEVMKETAIRKKMYVEDEKFFRDFYETLHAFDMSDIYLAAVDINKLKDIYNRKKEEIAREEEAVSARPDGKKKENRLKELENKKNRLLKDLEQISNIKDDYLVLSAIITAKHNDKVWTIHGGNRDDLMFLNANYELYYHILKDASREGFKEVDFFGSEGVVDKTSPIYGIYLFKMRFGGDFDEFIGEFDFITRPLTNFFISLLLRIRRRIRYYHSLEKQTCK